jgi:hypothetical protein
MVMPDGRVLHNEQAARMSSVITRKPPGPGDTYHNLFTAPIELYDAAGNPTGIKLVQETHTPVPPEIDDFRYSLARITMELANGKQETMTLAGPTTVEVDIEPDGKAADTDGNGLDQVRSKLTRLLLRGNSSMGKVQVRLDATRESLGQIEETANNTPGVLDLPPFTPTGQANSFFDVFFEIEIGGQVFHTAQAAHMQSVITHKPPGAGEAYVNSSTQPLELLDANGNPTGIKLVKEIHVPNPKKEIDSFPVSLALLTIQTTNGQETLKLAGPTVVQVSIPEEGWAADVDGDGLDSVPTEMQFLTLKGLTKARQKVTLSLDSTQPTLGQIKEQVNNTPGTLDLPPFTAQGTADSFFDVFVEVDIDGQKFKPSGSLHMQSVLAHKPPGPRDRYVNPFTTPIDLLDANGKPTGIQLVKEIHVPNPRLVLEFTPDRKPQLTLPDRSITGIRLQRTLKLGPGVQWEDVTTAGAPLDETSESLLLDTSADTGFFRYLGPEQ